MHYLSLVLILGVVLLALATPIHHRPENFLTKTIPNVPPSNRTTIPQPIHDHNTTLNRQANGKVSIGYFGGWVIYRNFSAQSIDTSKLTHILYGFADCDADSGQVKLTDACADQGAPTTVRTTLDTTCTVLLSIGGWKYSQSGHFNFITSQSARTKFVFSAITILEDFGLDGIDIDFEYPSAGAQAQAFVYLLQELRNALDQYAAKKGDPNQYQITAAVPASQYYYSNLLVAQMDPFLDFWNLMAYDYAGDWTSKADYQANLYGPTSTGVDTDAAVQWYLKNSATAHKLVMGMPLFGRSFQQTSGIGQSYNGVGPGDYNEQGSYQYKSLPKTGAQVFENNALVSSYSYDSTTRELVSYDTPNIVSMKAAYILSHGLAGAMFWELSADKQGFESLVSTCAYRLGTLDSTPNHVYYPDSQFDNIKNGAGPHPGEPSPTGPITTVKPTTTGGSSPTTPPSPGGCNGLPVWSGNTAYLSGQVVSYQNHKWIAKWWTYADVPGGAAGSWNDNGAC